MRRHRLVVVSSSIVTFAPDFSISRTKLRGKARFREHGATTIARVRRSGATLRFRKEKVTRARSIFQIDAFTTRRFAGNPAAVMPLEDFPADATLQAIAAENNLAETAFLVRDAGDYRLRWFTPATEVPLCGHATLASAAAVMERLEPGRTSVIFHSASGPLTVNRVGAAYVMDFPARPSERIVPPPGLVEALGAEPRKSSPTPSTTWPSLIARRSCVD